MKIYVPKYMIEDMLEKKINRLKAIVFDHMTIDTEGYRPGSMSGQKD